MTEVTISLDEATLEAAQRVLGTSDEVSTIKEALARILAADAREAALARELSPERTAFYAQMDRKAMW